MALKLCFLLLAAGAVLFLAECSPVEQPKEKEEDGLRLSSDSMAETKPDGLHVINRRSDRAQTLEDALNIPIAALEAVSRLLTNRFGSKQPDEQKRD